jgi:hypothetical protein
VHGETALWHAAYAGRMCAVAKLLRRRDLDIDVPDAFFAMTPLVLAVAHGQDVVYWVTPRKRVQNAVECVSK